MQFLYVGHNIRYVRESLTQSCSRGFLLKTCKRVNGRSRDHTRRQRDKQGGKAWSSIKVSRSLRSWVSSCD